MTCKYGQEMDVTVGVPQGSVLGPLLFLRYINDLEICLPNGVSAALYADDSSLMYVSRLMKF